MGDILVVEDDPDIAFLLQIALEDEGHVVRRAAEGEQGLARLSESLPELVVMDVRMPLLDGPGMAWRMFVEDAGRERIPILIVSGEQELAEIAQTVGTPYFLRKPFAPEELAAVVARALREQRPPRPAAKWVLEVRPQPHR
jgi:DNA-binding response OmpR family regulator